MTGDHGRSPAYHGLAGLKARRDALRQTASLPDPPLRRTLDAALAELDAAIEALAATLNAESGTGSQPSANVLHAERRLLRAIFADAPVPLFLLGLDGTVRRINRWAGQLLGAGPGYATGRPFTAFVDFPARAAVDTQLARLVRTGRPARFRCELLTGEGTRTCQLTAVIVRPPGDAEQVVIAAREPAGSAGDGPAGRNSGSPDRGQAAGTPEALAVASMTRRLDLVTTVTRSLLANVILDEAVTLQRCARLLADELSAWVIVDVVRSGRLYRQFVLGPQDERSTELARELVRWDPPPGSVPFTVHETSSSQLIAHAEDAGILGTGPDGVPLLMLLGTTSVLSVPLAEGERGYGVLTLARHADDGHFELADLGLVEELAEQVALAIKADRMIRRHAEVADALRASLLPRTLPGIPGVETAAAHLAASEVPEVGGDFCDVYRTSSGWGTAIGDVCGRGEDVAAIGAAARHAIRIAARASDDPAVVLTQSNEILLAGEFGGRFVTASAAQLRWQDRVLRVTLASAGHPAPLLIRPDGRVHRTGGGGLPLGLFADAGISLETYDLAIGDALVFFTDGLPDARGTDGTLFDDRMIGDFSALAGQPLADMVSRMRDLVAQFCGNICRDDITLLALRAQQPPAGST